MAELNIDQLNEIHETNTNEFIKEKVAFAITDDKSAEWALTKIKEERADFDRQIEACKDMIKLYEDKTETIGKRKENSTGYLECLLNDYFLTVAHKKTKSAESYKLPSGSLKRKFGTVEYVKNDDDLMKWLEKNKYNEFIKSKKSVDWAGLKKTVTITTEGKVVSQDGEVIEAITANTKADTFVVEVK